MAGLMSPVGLGLPTTEIDPKKEGEEEEGRRWAGLEKKVKKIKLMCL